MPASSVTSANSSPSHGVGGSSVGSGVGSGVGSPLSGTVGQPTTLHRHIKVRINRKRSPGSGCAFLPKEDRCGERVDDRVRLGSCNQTGQAVAVGGDWADWPPQPPTAYASATGGDAAAASALGPNPAAAITSPRRVSALSGFSASQPRAASQP